ncbi:MAG: hypothetical protein V2I38_07690, partial [Alcanivoracaceae bacterium]|nr:hypothetical protein [Alcanivoracaceae bacterium]
PEDIWEIFQILTAERRKREIEPTLSMIRNALMTPQEGATDAYAEQRLTEMLELIELVTGWVDDMSHLDQKTVVKLMKLGGGVQKLLGAGKRPA